MPLERRNEPHMLRQFHKMYPSYNINPLLRKRHQDLVEAQSFNQWLSDRRLRQEGESYGRARQDDGGREPADSPVEIRSRGARGHPAHGKGRGGRQEHERVSGPRGADVSKWRSAEATASA